MLPKECIRQYLYPRKSDGGRRGLRHHRPRLRPLRGEGGFQEGNLWPVGAAGSVVDARISEGVAAEDEVGSQSVDQDDHELADPLAVPESLHVYSVPAVL